MAQPIPRAPLKAHHNTQSTDFSALSPHIKRLIEGSALLTSEIYSRSLNLDTFSTKQARKAT